MLKRKRILNIALTFKILYLKKKKPNVHKCSCRYTNQIPSIVTVKELINKKSLFSN